MAQKGESLYKIATLMGNSPDICRRHYAAPIPETMHDVVEFQLGNRRVGGEGDTRELLEQILLEVKGKGGNQDQRPQLRVAR